MNKEFIPYEEALALKELGIDEPCFGFYAINKELISTFSKNTYLLPGRVSAPTYATTLRWFREKYNLEGIVKHAQDFAWYKWCINQYNENGKMYVADWDEYKTYEEAELACLKKLIEIVKK
jgi:thymidylate synthase